MTRKDIKDGQRTAIYRDVIAFNLTPSYSDVKYIEIWRYSHCMMPDI